MVQTEAERMALRAFYAYEEALSYGQRKRKRRSHGGTRPERDLAGAAAVARRRPLADGA